jgi:hypothetical protein
MDEPKFLEKTYAKYCGSIVFINKIKYNETLKCYFYEIINERNKNKMNVRENMLNN